MTDPNHEPVGVPINDSPMLPSLPPSFQTAHDPSVPSTKESNASPDSSYNLPARPFAHPNEPAGENSYNDDNDDNDDNDSAFGGSLIGCDTDTLSSLITDYRYENGRRYHAYKDGEYWVFYTLAPSKEVLTD